MEDTVYASQCMPISSNQPLYRDKQMAFMGLREDQRIVILLADRLDRIQLQL